MVTVFTPAELRSRFNGIKKSLIYDQAADIYLKLRVHADGEMPIKLIKAARPNESEEVRAYREKIYEAETQNPVEKVLGLLEKIRRSPDWMMRFDDEVPAIIDPEETPQKYLTEKYPVYGDIEYWLFEEALKAVALDANAVIAVLPKDLTPPPGNTYIEPIGQVFNSVDVVDFVPGDYAILKSAELSSKLTPEQQTQRAAAANSIKGTSYENAFAFTEGQVYYLITNMTYQKWEATNEGFALTQTMTHGLGKLPVFQMPGKFVKRLGSYTLKKTPLFPMLPHLNKAARESNDLDAGVIQHLYLERWRVNNTPCKTCQGTGILPGKKECASCKGTGMAQGKGPFNEIQIKPTSIGETSMPTPPVGYVTKDPEIIRIQNERVEQHIYRALASVNMEHLAETQLNQSGTAKAYDRDEVNNTIYTFAGMLAQIANQVVDLIIDMRYRFVVQNDEQRKKLKPVIPVPEKYDVVNSSFLISEYSTAKTAGLNSIILAEMQKEIGSKKFYANPAVADFVQTVMDLDPFPDKTIDEKGAMESQGLATKVDVVLSNYITDFVRRAMEENEGFIKKKDSQKREILLKYAQEKVDELSTSKQVSQDILGNQQDPGQQQHPGNDPNQNPGQNPGQNNQQQQQTPPAESK